MNLNRTGRVWLSPGAHYSPADGMCLMEAVAYQVGEAHTDRPRTVHHSLHDVCMCMNDMSTDEERQELVSLIDILIGSSQLHIDPEDVSRLYRLSDYANQPGSVHQFVVAMRDILCRAKQKYGQQVHVREVQPRENVAPDPVPPPPPARLSQPVLSALEGIRAALVRGSGGRQQATKPTVHALPEYIDFDETHEKVKEKVHVSSHYR